MFRVHHVHLPRFVAKQPLLPQRHFSSSFKRHLPRNATSPLTAGPVVDTINAETVTIRQPGIRRQIIFFGALTCIVFVAAAAKTNEETTWWSNRIRQGGSVWSFSGDPVSTRDIFVARYTALGGRLQKWMQQITRATASLPQTIKSTITGTYISIAQPYLDASDGKRMCWWIVGANTAVFLAWKFPPLLPFMRRSFQSFPPSGLSYTMITSVFSHSGIFHLAFNSIAFISFGQVAHRYLELKRAEAGYAEANGAWHLLAFYLAAGTFASLVSHAAASKVMIPRFFASLKQLVSESAQSRTAGRLVTPMKNGAVEVDREVAGKFGIMPSIGASGAVYACVTMTALAFPDNQISLIFPPTQPIPIQWGVGGMVMIDVIGILRGWRIFDHYAHLGGAAFGVIYYLYGPQAWQKLRQTLSISS